MNAQARKTSSASALVWLLACTPGGPRPAPAPTLGHAGAVATPVGGEAVASASPPGSATPPSTDACTPWGSPERRTIATGGWHSFATGIAFRFEGVWHDSYDDGRSDVGLDLTAWDEGASTQWRPSTLAPPRFIPLLGRCVRLVSASEAEVTLEVAPLRPPAATASSVASPPPCAPPPAGVAQLTDYAAVADGERYHVTVTRDDHGAWSPTPLPRMPRHHASRLGWTNLSEHPELAAAPERPLRFTIELLSHRVEAVPQQRRWRAEYQAAVEQICVP